MIRAIWKAFAGVSAVYTPKDFSLNAIMADIVNVVRDSHGLTRLAPLQ